MTMRTRLHCTAAILCAGAAVAACSNFLDASGATNDPNLPTEATRDQLFVGAQAALFAQQEGPLATIACQWMQQCSGVNGRFIQTQDSYGITAATSWLDLSFLELYSAGGLKSLRAVQGSAEADGDEVYQGIAQVMEALMVGTAGDIWGSIPYSEA